MQAQEANKKVMEDGHLLLNRLGILLLPKQFELFSRSRLFHIFCAKNRQVLQYWELHQNYVLVLDWE